MGTKYFLEFFDNFVCFFFLQVEKNFQVLFREELIFELCSKEILWKFSLHHVVQDAKSKVPKIYICSNWHLQSFSFFLLREYCDLNPYQDLEFLTHFYLIPVFQMFLARLRFLWRREEFFSFYNNWWKINLHTSKNETDKKFESKEAAKVRLHWRYWAFFHIFVSSFLF